MADALGKSPGTRTIGLCGHGLMCTLFVGSGEVKIYDACLCYRWLGMPSFCCCNDTILVSSLSVPDIEATTDSQLTCITLILRVGICMQDRPMSFYPLLHAQSLV